MALCLFAHAAMPPSSTRRVDRSIKRGDKALQPGTGPHLDGKEVGRNNLVQMSPEEIFPRCPSTPFRRGRDTMPLQNVGDRVTCQFVTQVGQGTLHSQITPGLVFRSETDNERGNLDRRPRASRCTLRTAVVFLGNQTSDAKPTTLPA